MRKLELLAPAGDLEKLKVAIKYGADAVYIGGNKYGLRAKAKNFDEDEMIEGIEFAHSHNVKVYVACNIFAHNDDFDGMAEYFKQLEAINVDGIIVADPGVFAVARESVPNMEIHISTQANNTNYHSVKFWHQLGAKRIVVARELSFNEIKKIDENMPEDFDIEAFVHGSMCISYSGRCLLSNYMTGRDANRGACANTCRWKYSVVQEDRPGEYMPIVEDDRGTYIYNSKDLCMIEHIDDLIESGVNSFKIEGRMKTPYYVATVVKAYREAIDDYLKDKELYYSKKSYYLEELRKASHRDFTTGFYYNKPSENEQLYESNSYIRLYDFTAVVKEYDKLSKYAIIEQRNKFVLGDTMEVLTTKGDNVTFVVEEMYNMDGEPITEAPHPQQIIKIKIDADIEPLDMFRKAVD